MTVYFIHRCYTNILAICHNISHAAVCYIVREEHHACRDETEYVKGRHEPSNQRDGREGGLGRL